MHEGYIAGPLRGMMQHEARELERCLFVLKDDPRLPREFRENAEKAYRHADKLKSFINELSGRDEA